MRMIAAGLMCLLEAAAPPPAQKIAVLEFLVEGGVPPVIGTQLTSRLADLVGRRPNTVVIAPDQVRALLEKEAEKQLLGCSDDSCFAEIGLALGADLIVKGRVSQLGQSGFGLSLSAVGADGKAAGNVSETWRGESMSLLELLEPMVDRLFASSPEALRGIVELNGAIDGSSVLIDDQVRGTVPAGQIGDVAVGARKIVVTKDGYLPFEQSIVVRSKVVTTVVVTQAGEPSAPVYATWWFWTIAAVAVAGAGVGTALVLGGDDPDPSRSGINIGVNADSAFTGGR
jgi:hypothetical protein